MRNGQSTRSGLLHSVRRVPRITYISETKNLPEGIRQHKNNVRKQNKECSAVAEHCEFTDHKTKFSRTAILEKETSWRKRLFLESWHIQRTPRSLNHSPGALSSVYMHGMHSVARGFVRRQQGLCEETKATRRRCSVAPVTPEGAKPALKCRASIPCMIGWRVNIFLISHGNICAWKNEVPVVC